MTAITAYDKSIVRVPDSEAAAALPRSWVVFELAPRMHTPALAEGFDPGTYGTKGPAFEFLFANLSQWTGWRDELRGMIRAEPVGAVTANEPFADLLELPDLGGVLGPQRCDRLANEFRTWKQAVRTADSRFTRSYDALLSVFEYAEGGGMVWVAQPA